MDIQIEDCVMDNVLEHLKNLEIKVAVMADKMDRQEKILEKLATVVENQTAMGEQISTLKESINVAFNKIREIDGSGTSLCGAHVQQTKEIERRIDNLETKAWQLWLAIFLQLIALIVSYFK